MLSQQPKGQLKSKRQQKKETKQTQTNKQSQNKLTCATSIER
jgi:hypothetical protein